VLEGVFGTGAPGWVVGEKLVEELEAGVAEVLAKARAEGVVGEVGELKLLGQREVAKSRPDLFVGRSQIL